MIKSPLTTKCKRSHCNSFLPGNLQPMYQSGSTTLQQGLSVLFLPGSLVQAPTGWFLSLSSTSKTLNLDQNAFAHEWSMKSPEHKRVSTSACVGPRCPDPSHICRHYPCLNSLLTALLKDAASVTTQEQVLAAVTLHLSGQQQCLEGWLPCFSGSMQDNQGQLSKLVLTH